MKTAFGILVFSVICLLLPTRALGLGEIQKEGFRSLDIRIEVLQSSASKEFEALSDSMKIEHEALMKDLQIKVSSIFGSGVNAVATVGESKSEDRVPAQQ